MKAMLAFAALLAAGPLAAQPEEITRPGTVAHRAAGTGFPEAIGEFRRLGVVRYDEEGRNISANYELRRPEGRVRATIYIYPGAAYGAPRSGESRQAEFCAAHFDEVEAAIVQSYRGAECVERGPAPARGADPGLAHRSVFNLRADIGRGPEALRSEARLYCFVGGDWLVKYRISASAGLDARDSIESFVRLGPWPGRMPAEIALR